MPSRHAARTTVRRRGEQHQISGTSQSRSSGCPGRRSFGLVLASFGTVILIRNRDHRRTGIFIAFWVLIPIALVLIGLLAKPVFVDRYVIITAPAFALLQAAALAQLRYPPALAIAAVAVAVPTITALAFWYHGRGVEDWRGAVALTAAEPADQVVVTPFWAMPAYEYYARGTAALQPSERDLWVISEGFSTSHAVQSARAAIGSRPYVLVDDRAFGDHLRVQRWRRR
jgi:mannosyltransferase